MTQKMTSQIENQGPIAGFKVLSAAQGGLAQTGAMLVFIPYLKARIFC